MGTRNFGLKDKLPQLGSRQRQIVGASGRNGSFRAYTALEKNSALHASDRGFLRRLHGPEFTGHEYALTDKGQAVYAMLEAKGLIDGND